MPELTVVEPAGIDVWRVGYAPRAWAWVGWEWATDGRFGGRWDDADGTFRTVYAGSSLLGCLVELLAGFRADPLLAGAMGDIVDDADDLSTYPTSQPGELDVAWLDRRVAGRGQLFGRYCAVTTAESVAALHPRFAGRALHLGLDDFDAAALKDRRARPLTQAVATFLHSSTDLDGVRFTSRHGDDLELWAVFERPGDSTVTRHVRAGDDVELTQEDPDVIAAMESLGLVWAEQP